MLYAEALQKKLQEENMTPLELSEKTSISLSRIYQILSASRVTLQEMYQLEKVVKLPNFGIENTPEKMNITEAKNIMNCSSEMVKAMCKKNVIGFYDERNKTYNIQRLKVYEYVGLLKSNNIQESLNTLVYLIKEVFKNEPLQN